MSKSPSTNVLGFDSDGDLEESTAELRNLDQRLQEQVVPKPILKGRQSAFHKKKSLSTDFDGPKIINPNRHTSRGYEKIDSYGHSQNSDDESDSEYISDIEIDIWARPRKSVLAHKTRKTFFLFMASFIGLAIWLSMYGMHPSASTDTALYSNGTHEYNPTTIVVSIDGLHPSHVTFADTPNLHALMKNHAGAPYIVPVFPSLPYPNHWTIATGLYPSHHGIISDTFYDDAMKTGFASSNVSSNSDTRFWANRPIWQTASYQGISSALQSWPGSNAHWSEKAPIYSSNLDGDLQSMPNEIFNWVDMEIETRPGLIMSYVPSLRSQIEVDGLKSSNFQKQLALMDSLVGNLLHGLELRNLTSIVNLVVLSGSSMAPTSPDRLIDFDDLVELANIEGIDGYPLLAVRPKPSINVVEFYKNLKSAQEQFGQNKWDVYMRETLPSEYKLGGSSFSQYKQRLAPLWLIPRTGWAFTSKKQDTLFGTAQTPQGLSGFNNTDPEMRTLFFASGPYFKNKKYKPFGVEGVYNLLCGSLNMRPNKNDGPSLKNIS